MTLIDLDPCLDSNADRRPLARTVDHRTAPLTTAPHRTVGRAAPTTGRAAPSTTVPESTVAPDPTATPAPLVLVDHHFSTTARSQRPPVPNGR